MSWLSELFKGKKKKKVKYETTPSLYEGGGGPLAQEDFDKLRAWINDRLAGKELLTDADWAHINAPGLNKADSNYLDAVERVKEQAGGLGHVTGSGILPKALVDLARQNQDTQRALLGESAAKRAGLNADMAAGAQAALQSLLTGQQGFTADQLRAKLQADMFNAQQSNLEGNTNPLVTLAGMGMAMFQGDNGGIFGQLVDASRKKAAAAAWTPSVITPWNPPSASWQLPTAPPLNIGGGYGYAPPWGTASSTPFNWSIRG